MIVPKKKDILNRYRVTKLGNTVMIDSDTYSFSYTAANDIVKEEYKNKYRYFGGLQCGYSEGSEAYKTLEKYLCEIAEFILDY
jgi:hypothetical protein